MDTKMEEIKLYDNKEINFNGALKYHIESIASGRTSTEKYCTYNTKYGKIKIGGHPIGSNFQIIKYPKEFQKEIDNIKKNMEKSLELLKELEFVTSAKYNKFGELVLKYKPIFMIVYNSDGYNVYKSLDGAKICIDEPEITITDNRIIMKSKYVAKKSNGNRYYHPHYQNYSQSACFGSGSGRNLLVELIKKKDYYGSAQMIYIWLKTYIIDSAYNNNCEEFVYESLKHGLPIFTSSGRRVTMDNVFKIFSDISQKKLIKYKDYDKNIEKYKKFKFKEA